MGKKYGVSFSWKRLLGISGMKSKISRKIGVPLTRYGRQRKVGRAMGCSILIFAMLCGLSGMICFVILFISR